MVVRYRLLSRLAPAIRLLATLTQLLGPIELYSLFQISWATEPWLPRLPLLSRMRMGIRASLSPELSLVGMCTVVIELVRCPRIAACRQCAVGFAGYYYALPDGFIWHTQSPETVVFRLQYGLAIVRVPFA